jgi:hypothetical protein
MKKAIFIDGKWFKDTEYKEFSKSKFVKVWATENWKDKTYNILDALDVKKILFIVPAEQVYTAEEIVDEVNIYIDNKCNNYKYKK